MFLVGWFVTPLQASVVTMLQTNVVDAERGRIMSVLNAAMSASTVLSMAFAGIAGEIVGVRNVFFLAGGIVARRRGDLARRLPRHPAAAGRERPLPASRRPPPTEPRSRHRRRGRGGSSPGHRTPTSVQSPGSADRPALAATRADWLPSPSALRCGQRRPPGRSASTDPKGGVTCSHRHSQ